MPGEFVSDIKEIRRRARLHMEQGPVTAGYKADRKTVIWLLNEALASELVCVLRYKRHYYMATGITRRGWRRSSRSTPPRSRRTRIRSRSASRSSVASPILTRMGCWPGGVGAGRRPARDDQGRVVAERIAIESYADMVRYLGDKRPHHAPDDGGDPREGRRARRRSAHADRAAGRRRERRGPLMAKARKGRGRQH